MHSRLSIAIITYNEASIIGQCLEAVAPIADEIVLVDSGSTDETVNIAQRYGARVFHQEFLGFRDQKNFALDQCTHDHVFFLDADEIVSPELVTFLKEEKSRGLKAGYVFNWKNNFYGKWMNWSGLRKDHHLRLVNTRFARWEGENIHEKLILKNQRPEVVQLNVMHYTYESFEKFVQKMNHYSTLSAEKDFDKKKRVFPFIHLFIYPLFIFIRKYFIRLGFLDGKWGFSAAVGEAFYRYQKYWKLYLLYHNNKPK